MSRNLTFRGRITSGVGLYSDMTIPGQNTLSGAPSDWPEQLCAGSLNVVVDQWPDGFTPPRGRSGGVYQLDDSSFQPAFVIPGSLITNNLLVFNGKPADAQVWRVSLGVIRRSIEIKCWAVRRFGSNVGKAMAGNVLELVSEHHLRSRFGLEDDDERVTLVLLEGEWGNGDA